MALAHNPTSALVSSAAATGTQVVTDADDYRRHTFAVTISSNGTVTAQGSVDGTRWVDATDPDTGTTAEVTATGSITAGFKAL